MTVFCCGTSGWSSYSTTLTGVMVASMTGELGGSRLGEGGAGDADGGRGDTLGCSGSELPGEASMALLLFSTSGVRLGKGEVTVRLDIFSWWPLCPSAFCNTNTHSEVDNNKTVS